MPRVKGSGREHIQTCQGTRKNGQPCSKPAVRDPAVLERFPDKEGPWCYQHLLGEEGWAEVAKRGGKHRAAKLRADAEAHDRSLSPDISLEDIYRAIAPVFAATLETGEPDWGARLAAVATLLRNFPRYRRSEPRDVEELIARFLPKELPDRRELLERAKAEKVYRQMREEWSRLKLRHHPITGLYVAPFSTGLLRPLGRQASDPRLPPQAPGSPRAIRPQASAATGRPPICDRSRGRRGVSRLPRIRRGGPTLPLSPLSRACGCGATRARPK